MDIILLYLVLVNALSLAFMLADKHKARRNAWRIPEATLLGIAAIGGSFGTYLGMRLARHKTLHLKFSVGVPILMALHIALLCWLYAKLA